MAVDIHKLFNEKLPEGLAKNREAALQIGSSFQFRIFGEGGGDWFVDTSGGDPKCYSGNPGRPDCTITISAEDFQKFLENPQANGMQLFFSQKMKIEGDQRLTMSLTKLFALRG